MKVIGAIAAVLVGMTVAQPPQIRSDGTNIQVSAGEVMVSWFIELFNWQCGGWTDLKKDSEVGWSWRRCPGRTDAPATVRTYRQKPAVVIYVQF
jgi:hypothetical protein